MSQPTKNPLHAICPKRAVDGEGVRVKGEWRRWRERMARGVVQGMQYWEQGKS
jgi:hypothetical protein